jgi:hypothetical protein
MGFLTPAAAKFYMRPLSATPLSGSQVLQRGLLLLALAAPSSIQLQADTSSRIQTQRTAGCYCHCVVSGARSGCTKMCELPKYASRWWATSCARPRKQAPAENPGASPRLPHPSRAEHARRYSGTLQILM